MSVTLEQYANRGRLDARSLPNYGLKDIHVSSRNSEDHVPAVGIQYFDQFGDEQGLRICLALAEKDENRDRCVWEGERPIPLYGEWTLPYVREEGSVLLVREESEALTAWSHGISCLGVTAVAYDDQNPQKDLASLQGLDVYVWPCPDEQGDRLVAAVREALPEAKVLIPPKGTRTLSQAHCRGQDLVGLIEQLKVKAMPIARAEPDGRVLPRLTDLQPQIASMREKASGAQERRRAVAELVAGWFRDQDRLVADLSQDSSLEGRPYLVTDDGGLWPIDDRGRRTRLALFDSGLRRTDPEYKTVVEELIMVTLRDGQQVRLSRWQHRGNEMVYVSCGPCHLVRSDGKRLEKLPNGTDGVWFASEAVYPEWSPSAPVMPTTLAAFRPRLEAPEGVPAYTPEVQALLFEVWIAGVLSDFRPLMFLLLYGKKDGGKTTAMVAVQRMLMGPETKPTPLSDDRKDAWTLLTTAPLVGLDNLDESGPRWFPDLLCAAVTGLAPAMRKLYTDLDRIERPVTAVVAITTRTARFCGDDEAERCLPLIVDRFPHADRIADADLLEDVDTNRDGLMSWATLTAARLVAQRREAPERLPLRFVDFARMTWVYLSEHGRKEEIVAVLTALGHAQALVEHTPPLIRAILAHWDAIAPDGSWQGTAGQLANTLREQGAVVPRRAQGIPRELRRSQTLLARQGIDVNIDTDASRHVTITLLRG